MNLLKRKPEIKVVLVPVGFDGDLSEEERRCVKHWHGNHWRGTGRFNLTHYFRYKQFKLDMKNENQKNTTRNVSCV
jgi:hypothetical protein